MRTLTKLGRLAQLAFYLGTGAVSAIGGARAAPRGPRLDADGGPPDSEVKGIVGDESLRRPWPPMASS